MENGWVHGQVFSKLDACCDEFRQWFHSTGNTKIDNFNARDGAPYNDKNGFNFVVRGENLLMELRIDNPLKTGAIKFCHSCGAEIEIKQMAVVTLKSRQKQIADGYEEVEKILK